MFMMSFRLLVQFTRCAPGSTRIAASCGPAELPAWLVVFAIRFASRIGVQALPHSTPGQEEAAKTEQREKSDD